MFTTGYQANLAVISGLANNEDTIVIDADSHASIYDGCRLSGADIVRFRHNNPDDLHKRLRRLGERAANALIIIEGIYSMLGDKARIGEIIEVKNAHRAMLLVDEAHSLGVLGSEAGAWSRKPESSTRRILSSAPSVKAWPAPEGIASATTRSSISYVMPAGPTYSPHRPARP